MLTGRDKEIQYLQNFYEKPGSQFIVLYGEKGVGKTRLVWEFTEGRPCFYYACRDASEREQQFRWARELEETGVSLEDFPTWKELFTASLQRSAQKQVFVLDEFQYLVGNSNTFMEEIVSFAEEYAGKKDLLILLLCSSISWVESSMVKKMGQTAGKISGLSKIKPLGFFELRTAFRGYSVKQAIALYAVLGGNPALWKYMSPSKSFKTNICETILSRTGALSGECDRILSEELRELNVYKSILSAIAGGRQKLNAIYAYTGFSRAKISVYLKNLMELELIEKVFSYGTVGRVHVQKGMYRISNHFVHFYFTYLYPHISQLETLPAELFYEKNIAPAFHEYMTAAFREACREYIMREAAKGKLPFTFSSMGEWAGKAGDIDIIAQGEKGETLLALCRCEKEKFPYEEYEWLLFLARQAGLRTDYIWLFTDNGFDDRLTAEEKENEKLSLILF